MHYSYEIDVLTTHTVAAPLEQLIKFTAGKLKGVDILFEVGDGFSSCLQLYSNGYQLLPTNQEGFYSADGLLVHAPVYLDMNEEDNEIWVVAWNRGGIYDHAVTLMFEVQAPNEPELNGLIKLLDDTVNRMIDLIKGSWL